MPSSTQDPNSILSEKRRRIIVWTLLCLMPIIGMAVDLVAPSLPAIADSLHVSSHTSKNVIAIYLLGYALGNFFAGFISDAWGRQRLLRMSLFGFVLVSLMPVIYPHIGLLLASRLLQGITIGAVAVLARAVFSDILESDKLVRLGPLIGAMWGLGPVIGPVIGGYLQYYINWQAGFVFFAFVASIGLIVTWINVPETHFNHQPLNILTIKNNLIEVLRHRLYIGLVILMGLAYSLVVSFNTAAPFLIQEKLHYSPVFFGHLALYLGLTFLTATFACRFLLKFYSVERLFFVIINVFVLLAFLALIASYFFSNSILLISLASAVMFFSTGFIFPLSMGKGLSLFRHIAGTASATMYLINILLTSLTSFIVSFISTTSAVSLMGIYFSLMVLCALVYWGMLRKA